MDYTFTPFRFLQDGYSQTVGALFWPQIKSVPGSFTRHEVSIEPYGHLSVVENRPPTWTPGKRIALLIHGLTGSENSTHSIRMTSALLRQNVLCIRMNMRGCGPGFGLAAGLYHSGRSEDVLAVVRWIETHFKSSPITVIGVSLGANASLKMAGELGLDHPSSLDSLVAISAPIHLNECSQRLSLLRNKLFDQYFCSRVLKHVDDQSRLVPKLVKPVRDFYTGKIRTLSEFDDKYLAPASGFKDAKDYYSKCSSVGLIPNIKINTLLITSKNDPIVTVEPYLNLKLPKNIQLLVTDSGGHAGWLSKTKQAEYGRFWLDEVVAKWAEGL